MSQDLRHAGKNCYYSNIESVSEYYNFPCFDLTYLTNAKVEHYVGLMQQKYILHWQHAVQSSTNFSTLLRMIKHPPLI